MWRRSSTCITSYTLHYIHCLHYIYTVYIHRTIYTSCTIYTLKLLQLLCICTLELTVYKSLHCAQCYMVYGIWYMVYGIWHMVYGIWYMVYHHRHHHHHHNHHHHHHHHHRHHIIIIIIIIILTSRSTGCIFAELLTNEPLLPGNTEMEQIKLIFKLLGR